MSATVKYAFRESRSAGIGHPDHQVLSILLEVPVGALPVAVGLQQLGARR